MSGLAGIINSENNGDNKGKIEVLLDKISHRGGKRKIFNIRGNFIGMNSNSDTKNKKSGNIIILDGKIYNASFYPLTYIIQ